MVCSSGAFRLMCVVAVLKKALTDAVRDASF